MSEAKILDTIILAATPLKKLIEGLGEEAYNLVLNDREVSERKVKIEIIYPRRIDDRVRRILDETNILQSPLGIDEFLVRVRGVTGGLLLQTRQDKTHITDPETGIILLTAPRIPGIKKPIERLDPIKYLEDRRDVLGGFKVRYVIEEPETLTTAENIRLIYIVELFKPGEVVEEVKPLVVRASSSLLIMASRKGFEEYNRFIGRGLISFINSTITRTILKRILLLAVTSRYRNLLYVETPLLAKRELYEKTGHLRHFKDRIYHVKGRSGEYLLRPMNCPHHLVLMKTILNRTPNPGKLLPIATYEYGVVFRDEPTGTLEPLIRVRQFTLDDLHILAPFENITGIIHDMIGDILYIYNLLGIKISNIELVIGLHDPNNPSKYLFTDLGPSVRDLWVGIEEEILSTKNMDMIIGELIEELGLDYKPNILTDKTAAFYGPKIDIYYTGGTRYVRLATIQLDVSLPRIFELDKITRNEKLVLIHSAIAGSLERFLGILLEENNILHPAISPIQAAIVFHEELLKDEGVRKIYRELRDKLDEEWIRALIYTIGLKKIGYIKKMCIDMGIPYLIVIGPREIETGEIKIQDLRSNASKQFVFNDLDNLADKIVEGLNKLIYDNLIKELSRRYRRRITRGYLKHPYLPPEILMTQYRG